MNGAVAVAFTPEPACAKAATPTELEQRIGELVAEAAIMVCCACEQYRAASPLTPALRTHAGDLFVQMFELQEATLGELDFDATAHREGKRAIMRQHGAMLAAQYGTAGLEAALDTIVSWPLDVAVGIFGRQLLN
jgi:hypothetical protein